MGMIGTMLVGAAAGGFITLWATRLGESALLRHNFRKAVRDFNQEQCPHHLHGRLKVYNRPFRKAFRRDVFQICAGCGKRMN